MSDLSSTSSSASLTVAVAQFAPGPNVVNNLERMRDLAGSAAEHGPRVIVFPEYSSFFDVPLGEVYLAHAEALHGEFASGLADLAREFDAVVVAGMVEKAASADKVHNTLLAVAPSGDVLASYRKMHLYDAFGARESDWMAAGAISEPAVFEVDGLVFGLQTCYDIRFPEVSRRLMDAGADVLLVPAQWVRGTNKELHWRTLLTARAIENTAFVVAADHRPPIGIGRSMILDPMGLTMVELEHEEGVAVATLSRSLVDEVRARNPALELRRFAITPRGGAA